MFRLWPVLLTAAPFVVAAISWVLRPHGFVISIWQGGCPFRLETRLRLGTRAAEGCSIHLPRTMTDASDARGATGWNWLRIFACRDRPRSISFSFAAFRSRWP